MNDAPTASDALAAAMRLLARREHSQQELRLKLIQRAFDGALIDGALDECVSRGYQSDQRFAEQFVRSRLERAQGPLKIRAELGRRGVASSIVDVALADVDQDWSELAKSALDKRFGASAPETASERARRERFLAGRGFSGEQARRAIASCHEAL